MSSVKDVRPGLVFKHSTKRQFQLEEQHRSANEKMRKLNKPVRVLEVEKREEGLTTAISSQNKGKLDWFSKQIWSSVISQIYLEF